MPHSPNVPRAMKGYGGGDLAVQTLILQVAAQLSYGSPQLSYRKSAGPYGASFAGLSGYLSGYGYSQPRQLPGFWTFAGGQRAEQGTGKGFGGYGAGGALAAARAYFLPKSAWDIQLRTRNGKPPSPILLERLGSQGRYTPFGLDRIKASTLHQKRAFLLQRRQAESDLYDVEGTSHPKGRMATPSDQEHLVWQVHCAEKMRDSDQLFGEYSSGKRAAFLRGFRTLTQDFGVHRDGPVRQLWT